VEGEGWKFFDEKIRPTPQQWRWIGDRRTRDQLLNAGSDPHKPHTFEHTFLGAPEDLAEVAEFLEGEGFLRARLGEGHLVMSRLSTLSADDINEVTEYLREVAEDHGVDYDGWGAAVVR
jgi:regulator of RNase E activity RraB